MVLDRELGRAKNLFQRERHIFARIAVGGLQHPHQLAQDDPVDHAGILRRALICNEPGGFSGLLGVVLHQVSNQHIRVDSGHHRPARLRIAASISSNDTRRGAGARRPFNSRTSTVAGTRTTLPSASTTNSTRSPALSLRWRRISPGIVVCPLLVIVETAISLHSLFCLTSLPYIDDTPFV